jgi:hypothetical protein
LLGVGQDLLHEREGRLRQARPPGRKRRAVTGHVRDSRCLLVGVTAATDGPKCIQAVARLGQCTTCVEPHASFSDDLDVGPVGQGTADGREVQPERVVMAAELVDLDYVCTGKTSASAAASSKLARCRASSSESAQ